MDNKKVLDNISKLLKCFYDYYEHSELYLLNGEDEWELNGMGFMDTMGFSGILGDTFSPTPIRIQFDSCICGNSSIHNTLTFYLYDFDFKEDDFFKTDTYWKIINTLTKFFYIKLVDYSNNRIKFKLVDNK